MPSAIDEIVVIAAETAKIPRRPNVIGGVDKNGKPVFKKVEAQAEDLPTEQTEFNQNSFGKEQDDKLVEEGLFPPVDKKLLGL